LSAIAGVSDSHFFPLFKSATGCTPIDFFIRLRMTRACELLQNQKMTIKEVADLIGYDDPFYFSRLFKSVIGVAPRDYRRMIADPQKTNQIPCATDSLQGMTLGMFARLESANAANSLPQRTGP
jgi:AraC-like DNA-binding protein